MTATRFTESWPRDNHILQAIQRGQATPIWVIDRLFFAEAKNASTVNRVTSRLLKNGKISKHKLYGKTVYLRLGPSLVADYGIKATECDPLDYHRLLAAMATHMFCFADPENIRKRALPSEVESSFDVPKEHLHARPYVIRTFADREPHLVQIRVSMSGYAEKLLAEQQESIRKYRKSKAWASLFDSGRISFVTFFPTEAAWRSAHGLFAEQHARGNYPAFQTFVYPELLKVVEHNTQKALMS